MALHHRNGGLVIKKVVEYSLNGIVDLILSIFAPPPKQSGCTTKKNEKGGRQSPSERMSIRAGNLYPPSAEALLITHTSLLGSRHFHFTFYLDDLAHIGRTFGFGESLKVAKPETLTNDLKH